MTLKEVLRRVPENTIIMISTELYSLPFTARFRKEALLEEAAPELLNEEVLRIGPISEYVLDVQV